MAIKKLTEAATSSAPGESAKLLVTQPEVPVGESEAVESIRRIALSAIAEAIGTLLSIGDLDDLETEAKSSLVAAINEARNSGGGGGGGGGGDVTSVNGKRGAVVLNASDVGALPDSTVIPDDSTVAGWGYTKNTGTYSKPANGIPSTDLDAAVQASLGKADTALQNHQDISGKENITAVVSKTSADTSQTLAADTFYVWPEMSALTITCPATGMYAFRFTSGSTATTLTMTGITMPDGFTVEADKVYEINIYNGYGVAQSWSVSQ